jgi:hypothetical protein
MKRSIPEPELRIRISKIPNPNFRPPTNETTTLDTTDYLSNLNFDSMKSLFSVTDIRMFFPLFFVSKILKTHLVEYQKLTDSKLCGSQYSDYLVNVGDFTMLSNWAFPLQFFSPTLFATGATYGRLTILQFLYENQMFLKWFFTVGAKERFPMYSKILKPDRNFTKGAVKYTLFLEDILNNAARMGHISIITWLMESFYESAFARKTFLKPAREVILREAVLGNQPEIVKRFLRASMLEYEERNNPNAMSEKSFWVYKLMENVAKSDSMEALALIEADKPVTLLHDNPIGPYAIFHYHNIVTYPTKLYGYRAISSPDAFKSIMLTTALAHGSMKFVTYLIEKVIDSSLLLQIRSADILWEPAWEYAAHYGNIDAFRFGVMYDFIKPQICSNSENLFSFALVKNQVPMLTWLKENGFLQGTLCSAEPWSKMAVLAALHGNEESFRWFKENGFKWYSAWTVVSAVRGGNLKIVKLILDNAQDSLQVMDVSWERLASVSLSYAVYYSFVEIGDYLEQYFKSLPFLEFRISSMGSAFWLLITEPGNDKVYCDVKGRFNSIEDGVSFYSNWFSDPYYDNPIHLRNLQQRRCLTKNYSPHVLW